jgi:CRISPR-associated endoribonuclease Cas6
MLRTLEITATLSAPVVQDTPTWQKMGSVFHSLFIGDMATRQPEYFEELHSRNNALRPFKISWPVVETEGGTTTVRWKITSLNNAMSNYLERWSQSPTPEWRIHQLDGATLGYQQHTLSSPVSCQQFAAQYFTGDAEDREAVTIRFCSPTTFKSAANKHYYPMPDPKLILQSGLNKWNAFAEGVSLDDPDLLDRLVSAIRFEDVMIRQRRVAVDKGRIPAFIGSVRFALHAPTAIKDLIRLILNYQVYCGVGAKAQMGLGDIQIVTPAPRHNTVLATNQKETPPHEQLVTA